MLAFEQRIMTSRRYFGSIYDYDLQATTLEDIGFDGDALHIDESYACHALCNEAQHICGAWEARWPSRQHILYAEALERQRLLNFLEEERERLGLQAMRQMPPCARTSLDFAYYVLRNIDRVARDDDELWAWANTPHADLGGMTPNRALRNGLSDTAWSLMGPFLC